MAITFESFVPEERKGGGGGGGAAAAASNGHGPGQNMGADMNHATDAAMTPMHEAIPNTHPVSGTALPKGTGAGTGTIRKGGRGGK